MTALTIILAMIPIAVSVSSGAITTAELAVVMIGGMISSTFLTLFVIPAIYSLVYQQKNNRPFHNTFVHYRLLLFHYCCLKFF